MLTLITGPMFSGKTTELNRQAKRFKLKKKRVLMIKYSKDDRYSKTKIVTHDNVEIKFPTLLAKDLNDIKLDDIKDYDVLALDEGQFLGNVASFAHEQAKTKIVLVAALNSDFNQNPFPNVSELVSKCGEIVKLNAVCSCGNDATFSKLLVQPQTTNIEQIGGAEMYAPVCRSCY